MSTIRISKTVARQHAKLEAAAQSLRRCEIFKFTKRLKKLPRKHMSQAVLEQICG